MQHSRIPNNLLVIGREVGPIIQQIRTSFSDSIKIGAVDILGNLETRKFANWKFSVEKQTPNSSLGRINRRSAVELLFELASIMLEEREFEEIIVTTPFHRYPKLLNSLRDEVDILHCDIKSVEKTYSDWIFISQLLDECPEYSDRYQIVSKEEKTGSEGIFIPFQNNIIYLDSNRIDHSQKSDGFFTPIKEIHCSGFVSSSHSISFLGIHTLQAPIDHTFFYQDLERNFYFPFTKSNNKMTKKIINDLTAIIHKLELKGAITFYFSIISNEIVPLSCSVLPDENFDLWNNKLTHNIIPFLLFPKKATSIPQIHQKFGYKCPVYSKNQIEVPFISPSLACQRNIPGIFSHPEYPFCALLGTSENKDKLISELNTKKIMIRQILKESNL